MTLKKLIFWIWSTWAIGAGVTIVIAKGIELFVGKAVFGPLTKLLLEGLTFAAVAQLGFFAYLIFNWLSMGLIRNQKMFAYIQVLLLLVVVGNLVYQNTSKYQGTDLAFHLAIPSVLILVSVGIAWLKAKWTKMASFIPTLFFMTTVTILEATPSMNSKAGELPVLMVSFTVFILAICNAWQILNLHRWTKGATGNQNSSISPSVAKAKS